MLIRGFSHFGYNDFIVRNTDVEGSGGTEGEGTQTQDANAGEGSGTEDIQAQIAKAVEAAVADAVAGLKKKNEELIGKTKKLTGEIEAAKGKPSLTDEEYTEFRTLKERMEHDKLLAALAAGKSEEVIESVTRKTRLDYEAKLAVELEDKSRYMAEATSAKAQLEQFVVSLEITRAAASVVKPQYTDLVTKLVAERVKMVDGAARVTDTSGEVQMTSAGKPVTVAEYIETMRSTYSDLFVPSTGGGAGGSGKKAPGGSSGRLSMDAVENLPMDEYFRLRSEGKI